MMTDLKTNYQLAYSTGFEHITDELLRLDLLIRSRLVTRRQNRAPSPLDSFMGLVLSEEEVSGLLAAEPAANETIHPSLKEELAECDERIEIRLRASADGNVFLPLIHLSRLFRLTTFEQWALIVCLAPELNRKYEKLYGYLQDDVTRKKPTVDLVTRLICGDSDETVNSRLTFSPDSSLIRHRLVNVHSEMNEPLLSSSLKLDNRIVDYLLGFRLIDARLAALATLMLPVASMAAPPVEESIRGRLSSFARSQLFETDNDSQHLIFYLRGPAGTGKRSMAEAVCRDLDLPLITADMERVLEANVPFSEAVWVLCREAVLQPAALCIENVDLVLADEKHRAEMKPLLDAIGVYSRLTFLLGAQSWRPRGELAEHIFIDQEFTVPPANVRKTIWKKTLAEHLSLAGDADLGSLASNFQFTSAQIRNAVKEARALASWRLSGPPEIYLTDLQKACRDQSKPSLSSLAQKIEPRYTWEDIVLPADQVAQLHEICIQARHRDVVFGDWGFGRKLSLGRGLNVLFSGPAGTGKTMAAEVIAGELGLELYKIDLSQVVSKYIGETEKNLNQVFSEAKSCYAILFFDEADALFGKRSEVKDAHDRYSNIEIGYLLQKMEEYDGIAILATNLRQNLDEAFVRRLQVIVDFPFPNETYRKLIWEVIFPCESPIGKDVDLDVLAREIGLAGGSIKNIALAAAFFAAEDGGAIRMRHLVGAARREYQKLGRLWSDSRWSEHLTV